MTLERLQTISDYVIIPIRDKHSGRLKVSIPITQKEYLNLFTSENKDFKLSNLLYDPQTNLCTQKAIKEYLSMKWEESKELIEPSSYCGP